MEFKVHRKNFRHNRRALSPIFATLILVAIVIVFGSTAYLYAANITNLTTDQISGQMSASQPTISERIGIEYVHFISSDSSNPTFPPNPSPTLTIYVINYGTINVQISGILLKIYDNNHNLVSTNSYNVKPNIYSLIPIPDSNLEYLNGDTEVQTLLAGAEGYVVFKLPTSVSLTMGLYSIQLVTKNGSTFEYAP